jgi:hypothetical protein
MMGISHIPGCRRARTDLPLAELRVTNGSEDLPVSDIRMNTQQTAPNSRIGGDLSSTSASMLVLLQDFERTLSKLRVSLN